MGGWRQIGGSSFYHITGSNEGLESYRLVSALNDEMPKILDDGRVLLFWNLSPPGRNRDFMDSSIAAFGWNPARFSPEEFDVHQLKDSELGRLKGTSSLWLVLLSGDDTEDFQEAQWKLINKGVHAELHKNKSLCEGSRCIHFALLGISPPADAVKDDG